MNLNELQENKKTKIVKRALREHYELNLDFDSLNLRQVRKMLGGVRGLLSDVRGSKNIYESQSNGGYLKLVMMEQALSDRLADLLSNKPRIVVENEVVLQSQVILAAQDMVNSLQKMIEDVSKMNVEELNAVVTGMKNEFGTEQGEQFNVAAAGTLSSLQQALSDAKISLEGALNAVTTGEAPPVPGSDLDADLSADLGAEAGAEAGEELGAQAGEEIGSELSAEMPETEPEPEEDLTAAGRERR